MSNIPESHPLRASSSKWSTNHFDSDLGLRDSELQSYIANMLADFCDTEQLYKIRDAAGRPLHDVGEMLLESDPIYGEAPSFDPSARSASTSVTTPCSLRGCSPKASITIACAETASRISSIG